MLVEEDDCRKHAHHITQTHHRVRHTQREVLDDIHPEHGTDGKADTTAEELPVDQQSAEIAPRKGEITGFQKTILHQHLSTRQEHTLEERYGQ